MIHIAIASPRGEGATTTAIAIARLLKAHGCHVTYRGCFPDLIDAEIANGEPLDFSRATNVVIEDSPPKSDA